LARVRVNVSVGVRCLELVVTDTHRRPVATTTINPGTGWSG
jgi:hypothetical protein